MKMSGDAELVVNVWEAVRDSLPHNKRADVARDLLAAFADFGFEAAELASIADEDPVLGEAFDDIFPPDEFDDEDPEEE